MAELVGQTFRYLEGCGEMPSHPPSVAGTYIFGGCPSWVNRVTLTARRELLLFPDQRTSPTGCVRSEKCHIRTHAAQHHSVRSSTRSAGMERSGQKKVRRSSRSQTSTKVSGAVLVNTPTLERRQLVQMTTVPIACTTGAYALLLSGLCAPQGTSGAIGIARIESSNTQGQRHC
jgi:hypothetical protein